MAQAAFLWTPKFTGYDLGPSHPLKPKRLSLTHELISAYGLLDRPEVVTLAPQPATQEDLLAMHSADYIEAVHSARPGSGEFLQYGLGTGDNPIFEGMYEAGALYSGASLLAAETVFRGEAAVAFNISGGLHHAHRNKAAGFCIFNDPALAIARLLKLSAGEARIVYLDIDAHHGDGVQAAFYDNPRVLTISLHETGRALFPGTGETDEIGQGEGKGFCVNLPFAPYSDDETYLWAFGEIIPPLLHAFKYDFLVTQLGVDSHFRDPITHLCLTTAAYEKLFAQIRDFAGCGWVALGGGGYALEVVPRVWTLAFGYMLGEELAELPPKEISGRRPLRDESGPQFAAKELAFAREFAAHSVAQIKKLIFPYHRL